MNCNWLDDLRNRGNNGEAGLSATAREHLQGCEDCRELQALWESSESTVVEIPLSVQGEIHRRILAGLRPVSPLFPDSILIAILILLVALAIVTGVGILGLAGWRLFAPWQAGIIFSLLGGSTLSISHVVVRQMVPGARQHVTPRAAMAGVFLCLLAAFVFVFPYKPNPHFVSKGLKCWSLGLTVAAGAVILFSLLLRRAAWLSPTKLGSAAGFLGGLAGLAVLEIYCPFQDRGHVAFWHLGAVATATFIGRALAVTGATLRDRQRP